MVFLEDVFNPFSLVFPGVSVEIFDTFFCRGFVSWEVLLLPLAGVRVDRFLGFSS